MEATDVDVRQFVEGNIDDIRRRLNDAIQTRRCIKWYATLDVSFQRTDADGNIQRTTARFRTTPTIISDVSDLSIDHIASEFLSAIENFNTRGSNWVVECLVDFRITYAPYRPTQGSSFIPTPREIALKRAIVNVQNDDELCLSLIHI